MNLNDFQKGVVKQIINRKVRDINTFYNVNFSEINESSKIELIESIYYSIIDYLDLINKLENESLIFKIDISENSRYIKNPKSFSSFEPKKIEVNNLLIEIDVLFRNNIEYEIRPTFSLQKFYENECKTSIEFEKENEVKRRNRYMKLTISVAVASIVLSLITGIVNYITYQKERVVTIQNQKDTVRVILVDTLKNRQ